MFKYRSHWKKPNLLVLTAVAGSATALVAGSIFGSASTNPAAPWRLLPPAPIRVDAGLTSVWTGREMLVSGVAASPDGTLLAAEEAAAGYNPASNRWRRLSAPPRTESYCRRTAVWTGDEMVVWGCGHVAFNPATNRWRRLPPAPVGAPGIAVWTGREVIGWGGGCCGDATADGAAYDPARNTWRRLAPSPLAACQNPIGAWTGRELIMFVSGRDPEGKPIARSTRAAAYDPASDAWRPLAPPPELREIGVWDGRELLLVGGTDEKGYAYNPVTNGWRSLPALRAGRTHAVAAWTGRRLLIFGGETRAASLIGYDPVANRWSSLPKAPLRERAAPAAVWTGDELIIWGGVIGTPGGTSIAAEHPVDGAAFDPSSGRCCRGER